MKSTKKVRYAVVGMGYIAQIAVLPAFKHAEENSELVAIFSNDPIKRKQLSKKYKIKFSFPYSEYDKFLSSGQVDAVYICLPNNMHKEYTVRAARRKIHVLCEKPLAVTEKDCAEMVRVAKESRVKLMTAYRLHFDPANMKAVDIVKSGKIGTPRIFNSVFSQQVKAGDIRLQRRLGGGTVYDLGVYCINAARYLFRDEPIEVTAFSANNGEKRFHGVDEMTTAILKFPNERIATFTSSFGASDMSFYEIVGTKGNLRVDPAYEYAVPLVQYLTVDGKQTKKVFKKEDQFAPELIYFSNCVLNDKEPEPSGEEGLADVRIIRAIYHSARNKRPVKLHSYTVDQMPSLDQVIVRPPIKKPTLVHASPPSP